MSTLPVAALLWASLQGAASSSAPAPPADGFVERLAEQVPPALQVPSARLVWALAALDADDLSLRELALRALAEQPSEAMDAAQRLLGEMRWRRRALALELLRRAAPLFAEEPHARAVALGCAAAGDAERPVRRAAARLLGELCSATPTELAKLTRDDFFDIRIEAIRACARIADAGACAAVAQSLGDPDASVPTAAVDALARMGEGGVALLAQRLQDSSLPLDLRLRALSQMRALGVVLAEAGPLQVIASNKKESRDLRVAAAGVLAASGASADADDLPDILVERAIGTSDLWVQDSALAALRRLGAPAAESLRRAVLSRSMHPFVFRRLMKVLPRLGGVDAEAALKSLFDELGQGREEERAAILSILGRRAPAGWVPWLVERWALAGEPAQLEALRMLRGRDDVPEDLCKLALAHATRDVRRIGFQLAIQSPSVSTDLCISAVAAERDETLRGEWLEGLPRRRPQPAVRSYLLDQLQSGDPEFFESVVAGLEAFRDDDTATALIHHHDRVYEAQLRSDADEARLHWRVRRMILRSLSQIGGPRAIDFLRLRARAERAVDGELAAQAARGLATLAPDDPTLRDLLYPPSLRAVRAEAAIARTRRGDAEGIVVLTRMLRLLDADGRRRAFDALAVGGGERHKDLLQWIAVDEAGKLTDETRTDAIQDLAVLPGEQAFAALSQIAESEGSLEARIEAIHALGRRGGDEAARVLTSIREKLRIGGGIDGEREPLMRALARALGDTRSPAAVAPLLEHLFERIVKDCALHLVEAAQPLSAHERGRQYDRELAAARGIAQLGRPAAAAVDAAVARLAAAGLVRLLDSAFLLDVAEVWSSQFPASSRLLIEQASRSQGDGESRVRALWLAASSDGDRERSARRLVAMRSLAAAGTAEAAVARALGEPDPAHGRLPWVWLSVAPDLARAAAAGARGDRERAIELAKAAAERGARDTKVLLDGASLLGGNGAPEEAARLTRAARVLAPDDRPLCEGLGWLLLGLGHHEEALEVFREALTLEDEDDPVGRQAWLGVASALTRLNRPAEAQAILRTLLAQAPELAPSLARHPYLREVVRAVVPPEPASAEREQPETR